MIMSTGAAAKLIVWSDRYSVGIARIDAQHRKLVDLINELHEAMLEGRGNDVIEKTLDALAAYTVTHFASEEGLMKQCAYPGYAEQKAEHVRLLAQVKLLQEKSRTKGIALTLELASFLKHWLIDHIAALDKKYTAHLRAAGIT